VLGLANGTATNSLAINVSNAAMTATANSFTANEGTGFTNQVLAHFTDANAAAVAGDFTASINWGDGDIADTGTVVVNVNGGFDVLGSHTYEHAGNDTLSVVITALAARSRRWPRRPTSTRPR